MTDIYIATKTQADYDALMRLAEVAGYVWNSRCKPTEEHNFDRYGCETVVRMRENMLLEYCDKPYYEDNQDAKIETIPNLADIKAIWNVKPKYKNAFNDEKLDTSDIFKDWALNDGVIILLENGSYDLGFEEVYKALAVEYKQQESEVMPEKVKLPKFMCDGINDLKAKLSIKTTKSPAEIADFMEKLNHVNSEIHSWIYSDTNNQWNLFDALRNGYEPEPEQLYYVPLIKNNEDGYLNRDSTGGHMYLDDNTNYSSTKTQFTMPEIIAIDPRYKAFAVPVEEVDE